MKQFIILLCLLTISLSAFSQSKLDSLENEKQKLYYKLMQIEKEITQLQDSCCINDFMLFSGEKVSSDTIQLSSEFTVKVIHNEQEIYEYLDMNGYDFLIEEPYLLQISSTITGKEGLVYTNNSYLPTVKSFKKLGMTWKKAYKKWADFVVIEANQNAYPLYYVVGY